MGWAGGRSGNEMLSLSPFGRQSDWDSTHLYWPGQESLYLFRWLSLQPVASYAVGDSWTPCKCCEKLSERNSPVDQEGKKEEEETV